jgi:hypothetical protein
MTSKGTVAFVDAEKKVVCRQCHDAGKMTDEHVLFSEEHKALPHGPVCVICGLIHVRSDSEFGWRQRTSLEAMAMAVGS